MRNRALCPLPSAPLPGRRCVRWLLPAVALMGVAFTVAPVLVRAQGPAFGPSPQAGTPPDPPFARGGAWDFGASPPAAYGPQQPSLFSEDGGHALRISSEQAQLSVIYRRARLIRSENVIIRTAVADPTIIEVVQFSPNEMSVIGLSYGVTTLTLWFEGDPEPLSYRCEVIRDPDFDQLQSRNYGRLEMHLADLFPNSRVELIPLAGKVIVRGQAYDAEEAAQILNIVRGEVLSQEGYLLGPQPINQGVGPDFLPGAPEYGSDIIINLLRIPTEQQVMLRVRVAELNRSMLRELGVSFSFVADGDDLFFASLMAGGAPNLLGVFEAGDVSVALNALVSNGVAKVLAEPNLVVLSGHPASFLAGGEFAVPTIVGVDGVQGQQTTFRGFGVRVDFIPTVLDRDFIRLQVFPELSEINDGLAVNGIPGLDVRSVATTVQLREGQTLAIAGILSHRMQSENTRIPFVGDIPWLGTIFSRRRSSMDETELVVLVTPEIVRPMDPCEVPPLPGYDVTWPNDGQFYFEGRVEGHPLPEVHTLGGPYPCGEGCVVPAGGVACDPYYGPSSALPAFGAPLGGGFSAGYGTYAPSSAYGAGIGSGPYGPAPAAPYGGGYGPGGYGPSGLRPGTGGPVQGGNWAPQGGAMQPGASYPPPSPYPPNTRRFVEEGRLLSGAATSSTAPGYFGDPSSQAGAWERGARGETTPLNEETVPLPQTSRTASRFGVVEGEAASGGLPAGYGGEARTSLRPRSAWAAPNSGASIESLPGSDWRDPYGQYRQ